ncbi:hypothetical protein [Rhodospirillum sp. A1_3_36]|uniref:hypothetical protein n=1 Tax=Rhodospirillum sp. A1_3_36 TaxID=3391666 RepID=UPI0039A61849
MRKALVTLAIGPQHETFFRNTCLPGWQAYAEAVGCDLIVFTDPLDQSPRAQARSPAWQKLLIFTQPSILKYDVICYADADILINPASPSIFETYKPNSVGSVRPPSPTDNPIFRLKAAKEGEKMKDIFSSLKLRAWEHPYAAFGITENHGSDYNTGVLVFRPLDFAGLFLKVYDEYEDVGSPVYNFEQWPLVHELVSAGVLHDIDPLYNVILDHFLSYYSGFLRNVPFDSNQKNEILNCLVRDVLSHSYFLHFAGLINCLEVIDPQWGQP